MAANSWCSRSTGRQSGARGKARIDAGEEALLAALALFGGEARLAQQLLRRGKSLRPVRIEAVEGAALDKVLELPAVEALRIEAPREAREVLEAAPRGPLGDELGHRLRANPLYRGERVADCGFARLGIELHRKRHLGTVDVRRQEPDAEPVQFLPEDIELVGIAEIQRHKRGEELDRA